MGTYYIGAFPPDYGGVTIKNLNLFHALDQEIDIKKIDFNRVKRGDLKEALRLIAALLNPNHRFVVGVAGKKTRKRFTSLLYTVNRKAMGKSVIMVMGGTAANDIAADPVFLKSVLCYKAVYVETQSMKKILIDAGVKNTKVYPNGRFMPKKDIECKERGSVLKCVFFSLVSPEKGVDVIVQAAKELPDIAFDIYGTVAPDYNKRFTDEVAQLDNVVYQGIFKGDAEEVYGKLAEYDVLLLPTRWHAEGIPGVLVEGKIAGLAEVVSDQNYNAELVKDGVEGVVLKRNTPEELQSVLQRLDQDRTYLQELKRGSKLSADQYYIENYIDKIKAELSK